MHYCMVTEVSRTRRPVSAAVVIIVKHGRTSAISYGGLLALSERRADVGGYSVRS